ncbi:MAG: hypothetical protein LBN38_07735 [Verrucomicrobiota bacterium]|nr:hypothetical protein [Verrucomicrobiota bacterium]
MSQNTALGNEMPVVARRRRYTRRDKLRIRVEANRRVRYEEWSALAHREEVYPCILKRWQEWRKLM